MTLITAVTFVLGTIDFKDYPGRHVNKRGKVVLDFTLTGHYSTIY